MKDYYAILGVPRAASLEQIKHAFRELARRSHPDVCSDPGAHERFVLIVEAYEVLSDPVKRAEYDRMWTDRSTDRRQERQRQRQRQEDWASQARNRARKYAGMSLDDLFNSLDAIAHAVWSGDDELDSLSTGERLAVGLNGWLFVLLLVLTFTVVAAPATVSWGLHVRRSPYRNNRFIGFGRLFTCMLQALLVIVIVAAVGAYILFSVANSGY